MLEAVLYSALRDVTTISLPAGVSSSGKRFEDYMVQQLYLQLNQTGIFQVFSPRYTLRDPTCSGTFHQFDVVVREEQLLHVVECKFRSKTGIDNLFAFKGKLIDYKSKLSGHFVSSAISIPDDVYYYAIAHRITFVSASLPPVQYMLQRVGQETDLSRRLENLSARLYTSTPSNKLLTEWKNAYTRFRTEGYS